MKRKLLLSIILCLCLFVQKGFAAPIDVCLGTSVTLPTCAADFLTVYPGGIWSSSDAGIAYYDVATGTIITVSAGTVIITYTETDACGTHVFSFEVTVHPLPLSIGGPPTVCVGATILLSSGPVGGTWSSSTTTVATVSSLGVVTGVAAGTSIITYTLPSGCYATKEITVVPTPAPITGTTLICLGGTTVLSDATLGGTWSSSDYSIATITGTGVVTGVSAGTAIISYILSTGCYAVTTVTVAPAAPIQVCEIAPVPLCDNTFTYCSGLTLVVSGAPAGSTYNWSPSIASISVSSSSVSGGVAYTTYTFTSAPPTGIDAYSISSSMSCIAPYAVSIVVPTGTCGPCASFSAASCECVSCAIPPFRTITASTLNSGVISTGAPGYYFIVNDVDLVVSPAPGSVFLMNIDKKMTIPVGYDLMIQNNHIYSPQGCQWQGIVLQATGITSPTVGKLAVHNSLIENASVAAIKIVIPDAAGGPSSPPYVGSDIINCFNTTFNFNAVGISITEFDIDPAPFRVAGCTFTNRDFTCYHTGPFTTAYYPFVWPASSFLRSPNPAFSVPSGSAFNPGYNVDTYTPADEYTSSVGIHLDRVGKTVLGASPGVANIYHGITIGDNLTPDNTNLFDTLGVGISTTATNLICFNNVFRRLIEPPSPSSPNGTAIGVTGTGGAYNDQYSLQLLKDAPGTQNKIYNCTRGIATVSNFNLISQYTEISATNYRTSHTIYNQRCLFGYKINPNIAFDRIEITNNIINNVNTGIGAIGNTSTTTNPNGDIVITNNAFNGLLSSTSYEDFNTGIDFSGGCVCSSTNGNVMIEHNIFSGLQTGMKIARSGLIYKIRNNTIIFRANTAGATIEGGILADASSSPIYGIDEISGNTIYGDVTNNVNYDHPAATYSSSEVKLQGIKGIYLNRVTGPSTPTKVICNTVRDISIGFKFEHANNLTWKNNTMLRNRFGMVLHLGLASSSIGIQGSDTDPADNRWDESYPLTWPGWDGAATGFGTPSSILSIGTGIYQTFVVAENPLTNSSSLFVRPNPSLPVYPMYNPQYNGAVGGGVAYVNTGTTATSSILISSDPGLYVSCPAEEALRPATSGSHEWNNGRATGVSALSTANVMPGKADESANGQFTIQPNPSKGDIIIKQLGKNDMRSLDIKVLNELGQTVYGSKVNLENKTGHVSLGNVSPGMYVVEIVTDKGEKSTHKIVIEK